MAKRETFCTLSLYMYYLIKNNLKFLDRLLNLTLFLPFFSPLVVQTERQVSRWFVQCLREQSMLLEIIFLYYAYFEMAPSDLLALTKLFKEQGFGSRQTNRHLVDETMDPFVDRIG